MVRQLLRLDERKREREDREIERSVCAFARARVFEGRRVKIYTLASGARVFHDDASIDV